jgi:hypothetical protein
MTPLVLGIMVWGGGSFCVMRVCASSCRCELPVDAEEKGQF